MNRLIFSAAAVVALAVAVVYLVPRRTATISSAEDRPSPLAKINTADVTKIVLEHQVGQENDRHQQKVVLTRGPAEGEGEPVWSLAEPVQAEANKTSVDSLLTQLGELEITDVASEQAESHEDLEVDESKGISVQVFAGETPVASFILGKYTSGHTMLRLPEQDIVYRAPGSLRYVFGKEASDWRDKRVFDVDPEQISYVEFENENGFFGFSRAGTGDQAEWTLAKVDAFEPAPEEDGEGAAPAKAAAAAARRRVSTVADFEPSKVKSLVTSVARLRCTDFADGVDLNQTGVVGEKAGRVLFKVGQGESATTYTVRFGAEADNNVYAQRADREQVYLVTKYLASRLEPDMTAFQKRSAGGAKSTASALPDAAGGQVPPEVLKAAQDEMNRQKLMKQLAAQAGQ